MPASDDEQSTTGWLPSARWRSLAKWFAGTFAVVFPVAFAGFALSDSPAKPWSTILEVSAMTAGFAALFIAWKVDEGRRDAVKAAAALRVLLGKSPAVFVDEEGDLIPDDQASPDVHMLREDYERFLEEKKQAAEKK